MRPVSEGRQAQHGTRKRARLAAFGLILPTCFAAAPALAYRTGRDLPELDTKSVVRWAGESVQFQAAGNLPPYYQLDGIDETVRAALAVWNAAGGGAIATSFVGASGNDAKHGDGVNTISFVFNGWGALSPREAAATTDVIYERHASTEWRIVEADIYINAQDYSWAQGAWSSSSKDLYTVLQHEVGHALGLLHPCEVGGGAGAPDCRRDRSFASSLMYPAYQLGVRGLSDDDRAGLCFLYGCDPTCDPSLPCSSQNCGSACPSAPPPAKAECGSGASCLTAACESAPECADPSGASLGDPCSKSSSCKSGICSGGFCAAKDASECEGEDCASLGEPLGAPCDQSSDCAGGKCLIGARPHSICTRTCGSETTCPSGWSCERVEGEEVCAPTIYVPAGGCAVGPQNRLHDPIWLGLPLLAIWLRRRRESARRFTT